MVTSDIAKSDKRRLGLSSVLFALAIGSAFAVSWILSVGSWVAAWLVTLLGRRSPWSMRLAFVATILFMAAWVLAVSNVTDRPSAGR